MAKRKKNQGDRCDWCGVGLDPDEGYRLLRPRRNMGAAFCRLEHIVPWLIKKNDWHIWDDVEIPEGAPERCSLTGVELDEDALYLVRIRGEHRIVDGFADTDALRSWATAGGRYA